MSNINTVLAARAELESVTPLRSDCGRLCAAACCKGDAETGMLLFPGEETLYEDCRFGSVKETGFALGGQPAKLFVCAGHCDRDSRPLACRLFPLFLTFKADGSTKLRIDMRAKAVCPLTDYGVKALDPDFRHAARRAYDLLLADDAQAAYLKDLDDAFSL